MVGEVEGGLPGPRIKCWPWPHTPWEGRACPADEAGGPCMSWKLDELGRAGSPSTRDRFYHRPSQHQQGLYLKIFLPLLKHGFVQKDGAGRGWGGGEKIHNRPSEQGLGRLSIMGYLIITSEDADTKLILQRAALNAIRLMSISMTSIL